MKRRFFGRGWLLCAVLASLTAVLASCAEGKEVRTLKKRESLSLTAEELLLSDRELFRIEKDGEGYLLFCDGEVSRLDAEFLASSWEENDGEPVQNEIFRWEREDGIYTVFPDGKAEKNGRELSLDLPDGDFPVGFWQWEDGLFLTVRRIGEEGAVPKTVLYRWEKDYPGSQVRLEGLTGEISHLAADGIYGYCLHNGEILRVDGEGYDSFGSLVECGINPAQVRCLLPCEKGFLLLTDHTLWRLLPERQKEKETIVIACLRAASPLLSEYITRFNRTSPELYAEIRLYEDTESLNLALLEKKIDVLVSTDAAALQNYARKGLLASLEEDFREELAEGAFFPGVVEASRTEGKLAFLPGYFKVVGMLLPDAFSAEQGEPETVRELARALDKLDDQSFFRKQCREYALNNFLVNGVSAWVNEEEKTCRFAGDDDFSALLEICARYAADQDEVLANDHATSDLPPLFQPFYTVSGPDEINLERAFEISGSGETSSGYGMAGRLFSSPTAKETGFAIFAQELFSVVRESPHEKEAREWVKWALSEDVFRQSEEWVEETHWGFSLRRDMADRQMASLLKELTTEERKSFDGWKDFLQKADHYGNSSDAVTAVIREEATRFFRGEITASQAAEYVQNRVSLYLAEQG